MRSVRLEGAAHKSAFGAMPKLRQRQGAIQMSDPRTTPRRVLAGSMRCAECKGRGEVSMGERHGFHEWDLCPACRGNTVVPFWKDSTDA